MAGHTSLPGSGPVSAELLFLAGQLSQLQQQQYHFQQQQQLELQQHLAVRCFPFLTPLSGLWQAHAVMYSASLTQRSLPAPRPDEMQRIGEHLIFTTLNALDLCW